MSSRAGYDAFRDRIYSGGSGGTITIGQTEKQRRAASVILIITIIVVVVLAAILIYFLFVRKKSTSTPYGGGNNGGNNNGGGGNNGGGNNGGGGTTGCTSNDSCPLGKVCNTTTHQCVTCFTNANCPTGEKCDPSSYTCKQCLADADCPGGVCDSGTCCVSSDPAITSVTTTMSTNSSFTVNYTYGQTSNSTAQVEVTVQTPSGVTLSTKLLPATGTVTLDEGTLALPNQHLYPGVSYRVMIRIKYSCVTVTNVFTNYTPFTSFTMPTCSTGIATNDGMANGADNPFFDNYPGAIIRFFSRSDAFDIGVISSLTSGIHPNLAENYYSDIAITQKNFTSCDPILGCSSSNLDFAKVPYGGAVGTTYYYRYFNIGGSCISQFATEIPFTRTF